MTCPHKELIKTNVAGDTYYVCAAKCGTTFTAKPIEIVVTRGRKQKGANRERRT